MKDYTLDIFRILVKRTDETHPLTQNQICDILRKENIASLDRKTVGRCLDVLGGTISGYTIEHANNKGYYISERPFKDTELKILIDGVLSSRYLDEESSAKLVNKLIDQGSIDFKPHVSSVHILDDWSKTDNDDVFRNVEIIGTAIEDEKKISFVYSHFDMYGDLTVSRDHGPTTAYYMFVKNQRYYVMVYEDGTPGPRYLRIDKISDVKKLDEDAKDVHNIPGYSVEGITKVIATLPYMYSDEPQIIVFYAEEGAIDSIVDYFGKAADIRKGEDGSGRYRVSVRTSVNAMEYWALQYLKLIEIVSPDELRKRIRKDLEEGLDKYST